MQRTGYGTRRKNLALFEDLLEETWRKKAKSDQKS